MHKYMTVGIIVLLISCAYKTVKYDKKDIISIENIVTDKNWNKKVIQWNETSEYAIVYTKKKKLTDLFFSTKYFIYSCKEKSNIYEDNLYQGNVKWKDKYTIFATGYPKKNQKTKYSYNVKSKNKWSE